MNYENDEKATMFEFVVVFITLVLLGSCIWNLFLYSNLNRQRKNVIYQISQGDKIYIGKIFSESRDNLKIIQSDGTEIILTANNGAITKKKIKIE
jgi:uncharacterized membrane protein YvbJ